MAATLEDAVAAIGAATAASTALTQSVNVKKQVLDDAAGRAVTAAAGATAALASVVETVAPKPVTAITYDSEDRVTSYVEGGVAYRVTYDSKGRPASVVAQ